MIHMPRHVALCFAIYITANGNGVGRDHDGLMQQKLQ